MAQRRPGEASEARTASGFGVRVARAGAASLIFGLPMLMTMEMWWLGFTMPPARLALLLVVLLPVLTALSSYSGFERTRRRRDDVADALIAFGIGFITSTLVLALFGIVTSAMPLQEIVGKIAIQTVPASFGAALARAQLAGDKSSGRVQREPGYFAELLLMAAGALFLAFNLAPTEEMPLLAYHMTSWQLLVLVIACVMIIHVFVYSVGFTGGSEVPEQSTGPRVFLHFAVTGYVVTLLISGFVLWSFGRFDNTALAEAVQVTVVLAFPGSVGAAAARLIL